MLTVEPFLAPALHLLTFFATPPYVPVVPAQELFYRPLFPAFRRHFALSFLKTPIICPILPFVPFPILHLKIISLSVPSSILLINFESGALSITCRCTSPCSSSYPSLAAWDPLFLFYSPYGTIGFFCLERMSSAIFITASLIAFPTSSKRLQSNFFFPSLFFHNQELFKYVSPPLLPPPKS